MKSRFAVLFLLVAIAVAADAPKLPETSKARVLTVAKSAVIAQQRYEAAKASAQAAYDALQVKMNIYNAVVKDEAEKNKLPKGAEIVPNVDTDEVNVVIKEEKK